MAVIRLVTFQVMIIALLSDLEGHISAEFSTNPKQTHLVQLFKVFRIAINFQAGMLEQVVEGWPSRIRIGCPCLRWISNKFMALLKDVETISTSSGCAVNLKQEI